MLDLQLVTLVAIIILAIAFGAVNGFNDAANAIAPAIGSRSLSPRKAIMIAAAANLVGAASGTLVAKTIGKGIIIPEAINYITIISALLSIITWGIFATKLGLPISLHHGFIAGLAAAGIAVIGFNGVVWSVMWKILTAVLVAPLLGFTGGFIVMILIYWVFRRGAPGKMRIVFSRLQYLTTAFMAYSHGKNDGQMPIGVITMALVFYYNNPKIWDHLSLFNSTTWWVILISAVAISTGTALGGWRVIKTMGTKMSNLRPHQGFAATAAAASVIEAASQIGMPVSTTHCITASVAGVGAASRFSAVRWGIARNIVAAWVLTFPICGILGYFFCWLLHRIF